MAMELELALNQRVSYVMYQNRMDILLSALASNDETERNGILFKMTSSPKFFDDIASKVECIEPFESTDLSSLDSFSLELDPSFITGLTERITSVVTLSAEDETGVICSVSQEVSVLPFDYWPGTDYAELIASFVTPNAPSLVTIRSSSSDILKSWNARSSLEGYQSEDRDRVLTLGAAVYAALERSDINYVNPPAGFETSGQRVRLADQVLSGCEGTCVDLAVLYASVLESIGINTEIFFVRGHAFVGFWLVDDYSPDIINWDSAMFTRRIRNKEFRAVECTAFTRGHGMGFDTACSEALKRLEDLDNFICAVDIRKSRSTIAPLPIMKTADGRWTVERSQTKESTTAPQSVGPVYRNIEDKPITKVDKWKRELLDITNRNNMINMKQGTRVIPLLVKEVARLEDRLADGAEFTIYSKPQEWGSTSVYNEKPFEAENYIGNYETESLSEIARNRIRTPMTDGDMERSLRSVYRLANKELDESGCNSLFVAIGVLRWYEGRSTGVPHYAPLILMPVELKKKQKTYAIKKLDEETVFNVTLSEKLRQEFEITIPNMDPLPEDDSGVNVDQILQIVRESISGKEGWDVLTGASLGVFSFSQFAMWKDLDANIESYRKNEVVNSLIENRPYPADKDLDADADPYGLCLTVPADGSQIKAVRASGESKTFVMHGPPGTGKSQTITNMITNALYRGKTVLFVAEKRAALEVVQKRLEDVGIGNHCLELHSNKTEKSKVIDQLRSSLVQSASTDDSKAKELMETIGRVKSKLDSYVSELHKERSFGLSAYEAISEYEAHDRPGTVSIKIFTSANGGLCHSDSIDIEEAVRNACLAYVQVKGANEDILKHVMRKTITASVLNDTSELIADTREKGKKYSEMKNEIMSSGLPVDFNDRAKMLSFIKEILSIDQTVLSHPEPEDDIAKYRGILATAYAVVRKMDEIRGSGRVSVTQAADALKVVSDLDRIVSADVSMQNTCIDTMIRECRAYCSCIIKHENEINEVIRIWSPDVFIKDVEIDFSGSWSRAKNAGLLSRGKAKTEFMTRISPYLRNHGMKFDDLSSSVGLIGRLSHEIRGNPDAPGKYSTDDAISAQLQDIRGTVMKLEAIASLSAEYNLSTADIARLYPIAQKVQGIIEPFSKSSLEWSESEGALSSYLETDLDLSEPACCMAFCDSLENCFDSLFDWVNWNNYAGRLRFYGAGDAIALIKEGMDADTIVHSVLKSMYKAFINICRTESEALRMFSASSFEESIVRFRNLDQNYTNLSKNHLKYVLSSRVPKNLDSSVSGTETAVLYKAINSTKIRKSIRKLLSEIPHVLPRICPCLLMSPQSVSQYITDSFPKFDLVIFDESSQITTSKAVGALGRAKNAVIAGDSRQLPPTSFFQKKIEATEEDDDEMDVDSFLDDCLSLNMPETYLEWHYRSKHESLITFSNRMFYDSKMLTFPSPNDQETKVRMVMVNGLYEKGRRCNPKEASEVVKEVYRRVMNPKLRSQSIGIIAFSISQQSCIQDMLDDLVKNDSDFFAALNAMPEGMFVKNLETVQGDERDVILFSIGYGPDASGTVLQNFGPINREGGGRRLNVAVSRARMEMIVFSSMKYTDVKMTSASSKGVRSIREFLRFAENGGRFENMSVDKAVSIGTTILSDVASELRKNGYDCHFNVGTSQFKVDIGVVNPDNSSEYILGLLSDGESYRSSENTRDREYARADVLRRLGWNLLHIWSVDWYFNRANAMNLILSKLASLREGVCHTEPQMPEADPNFGISDEPLANDVVFSDETPDGCKLPYVPYEFECVNVDAEAAINYSAVILRTAEPIIARESPIEETHLIKLYCKRVGIKRLTEQKRQILMRNLRQIFKPVVKGKWATYWAKDADRTIDTYRVSDDPSVNRPIDCIPYEELRNACEDTIRSYVSLRSDNAVVAISRSLGFKRKGAAIEEMLEDVIACEIGDGRIYEKDNNLFIKE